MIHNFKPGQIYKDMISTRWISYVMLLSKKGKASWEVVHWTVHVHNSDLVEDYKNTIPETYLRNWKLLISV